MTEQSLPAITQPEPDYDFPVISAPAREELVAFDLRVPPTFVSRPDTGTHLLRALRATEGPLSFEVFGRRGEVHIQLVAGEDDAPHIANSLEGYYPEASLVPGKDRLQEAWNPEDTMFVVDFGLSEEFFLPLASAKSFAIDPLIALVSALGRPKGNEFLCLQVLFEKTRNPWARAIREAVAGPDGTGVFWDAPEFLKGAMEKTTTPLFAVAIRVAAQAADIGAAKRLASRVEAFVTQFERPGHNHLIPLSNDPYGSGMHETAVLLRSTHRTGMLLSTEELASIVHVPDASVRQGALVRDGARTKAAPVDQVGTGLCLGVNHHRGVATEVCVALQDRLAHTHVIGASGTGKSTFLLGAALSDIRTGNGVVVLDPHGDLIDDILLRLPENRMKDVILFDSSDPQSDVGINILSAATDAEREHLAADVTGMFEKLATSWGDSMGSVLANAVLALVESRRSANLLDLRRFLVDPDTRRAYLAEVEDEEVRFFWEKSFPLIGTRSIGPILTRLDSFLRSKTIRRVVGVSHSSFAWESVLGGKQILLAKLSLGLLGEENGSLLGSLLVSQLHQAALRRQRLAKAERLPAFVYIDEFQHFVTPSMASLLSEGRKYAVGLVLAHQTLGQIGGGAVEQAVLGNAHTRLVFRVSESDAGKLAPGFSFFEASDLLALTRGQAIARLGSADRDCNLATVLPPPPVRDLPVRPDPAIGERLGTQAKNDEAEIRVEPSRTEQPADAVVPSIREEAPSPDDFLPVLVSKARLGGAEHRRLADLIVRLGQERGFRAVAEEPVPGGRVDVALWRDDVNVACEISVSTEIAHELGNARKCLDATFAHVILISQDDGKRKRLQEGIIATSDLSRVSVLSLEELALFLDTLGPPQATEKLVRGYKVRVKRQTQSAEDLAKRRTAVGKIMARSVKSEEGG